MIKKYPLFLTACTFFMSLGIPEVLAGEPQDQQKRVEIFLRALWQVGDRAIKPENQHCNLGEEYLAKINPDEKKPIQIKEPLIAEIAEMSAGGSNIIDASCDDKRQTRCRLELSHEKGDDANSTEYSFLIIGGKIRADSVVCVSTP